MDLHEFLDRFSLTLEENLSLQFWKGFEGCYILTLLHLNYKAKDEGMCLSDSFDMKNELKELVMNACLNHDNYEGAYEQICRVYYIRTDSMPLPTVMKDYGIYMFKKLCFIYKDYHRLDEKISPFEFISWAKDKDAFQVPGVLLDWYARHFGKSVEGVKAEQEDESETEVPQQLNVEEAVRQASEKQPKAKGGRPRAGEYTMSQKYLAQKLGVSVKRIINWEKGIDTPKGYPGRKDYNAIWSFIASYKSERTQEKDAHAMNRATPYHDMDAFSSEETY